MSGRRYYFNPETGQVGICRAQYQCRFGGVPHFESKTAAQEGYEQFVNAPTIRSFKSVYPSSRPLLESVLDVGQLNRMIDEGFVGVSIHPDDDTLKVLCYRSVAVIRGMWNESTKIARGLIVQSSSKDFRDAVVIERPWRKFFTLQQHESGWTLGDEEEGSAEHASDDLSRLDFDAPVEVTDKLDGSLGVLYRAPDGGVAFSTKGSFDSDQARHYTRFVRQDERRLEALENMKNEHPDVTFLFELTGPVNRIVIDYPEDDVVFLGAVDVRTGRYLSTNDFDPHWSDHGFTKAETLQAANVTEALALPEREGKEGVVIRVLSDDLDRQMQLKVKQDEYLTMHRLLSGLSRRAMTDVFNSANVTFGELRKVASDDDIERIDSISSTLGKMRDFKSSFTANPYQEARKTMSDALLPKVKELDSAYTFFENLDDELFEGPPNKVARQVSDLVKQRPKGEQSILFTMMHARLKGQSIDDLPGSKLMDAASKNLKMTSDKLE